MKINHPSLGNNMKITILLLCLMSFASLATHAAWYKHKSEAEIAAMTPAQRVDEWVDEQVHHGGSLSDRQEDIIRKYVTIDGMKAMPRLIEIIDEYDPTKYREGKGKRGERYDACWLMLGYIDDYGVRLKSSDEGNRAIDALERSIERMRKAGYGQPDQHEWEQHGRFDLAVIQLEDAKGVNGKDKDISSTLRFVYKIILSDAELSEFSQFLTTRYPDYPSWSKGNLTKDESQLSGGYPVQIIVLKMPERYQEVYLEFKKTK